MNILETISYRKLVRRLRIITVALIAMAPLTLVSCAKKSAKQKPAISTLDRKARLAALHALGGSCRDTISSLSQVIKKAVIVTPAPDHPGPDHGTSNPTEVGTPGPREVADWCKEADNSRPSPQVLKDCNQKLLNSETGRCLTEILRNNQRRDQGLWWPSEEEMGRCGCEVSHVDDQTTQRGRNIFYCNKPDLRISPIGGTLGILNLDVPGCMYDLEYKGTDRAGNDVFGPVPQEVIIGGENTVENCFGCHNREDPEDVDTIECPEDPPPPAASSTPSPMMNPTESSSGSSSPSSTPSPT